MCIRDRDTQVYICGENTIDNPASATVEVERHAARIDYQLVHKYYDVTDKTAGEAQVSITGCLLYTSRQTAGRPGTRPVISACWHSAIMRPWFSTTMTGDVCSAATGIW